MTNMAKTDELKRISFQAKFASHRLIKNYWIFYLLIAIFTLILVQLSWNRLGEDPIYIISFMLYALQMAFSGAGIAWVEDLFYTFKKELRILTDWNESKIENYIKLSAQKIFEPKGPFIFGLFACVIATIGDFFLIGLPFKTFHGKVTYIIFEFFYLFWSLAAVYIILRFAFFIHKLGNEKLRIQLIQNKNSGLMRLGKIHIRTALFAVIPYMLGIIARFFGEWEINLLLISWISIFAGSIIVYLFWPIYNIHITIKTEKENKLLEINQSMNLLLAEKSLSREQARELRDLIQIRDFLEDINTWPFELKKIIGLFSAILLPLLTIIVEIMTRK